MASLSQLVAPLRALLVHWRALIIVLVPTLLLPLALSTHPESRCAFGVLVMAIFWMTEVVPLPVTSLLPVVIFPLLDIQPTEAVCMSYLKETNMMFIGGLIVAIAVEQCNLHKRIALKTILLVGTSPRRLMLGFMITTMVLSMWISNTATTAMMVPIVQAVLDELKAQKDQDVRRPSQLAVTISADSEEASGVFDPETRRKSVILKADLEKQAYPDKETICYFLGIAYASNLGGAGTLTGTGTNLTFKGLFDSIFPKATGVNFASWMIYNVPLMLINVTAGFLWLQFLFMGLFSTSCRSKSEKEQDEVAQKEHSKKVKDLISAKYRELGPMTFHEGTTLFLFLTVVLLWFFREPEFIDGWSQIASVKIKDATPVMLIVFLLFILPSNLDFLKFGPKAKESPALLHWKAVHEKVPWGLVLLLGGGFAMASACKASGLSEFLGKELVHLEILPPFLILIVICTATTFLTEVSSNTAIANIVIPVLAEMAVAMKIHPLYFMMPAVLCCSYAFMLPVATPPNAIVSAASNMPSVEMIRAGVGMNFICLIILCITFPTLGSAVYDLWEFPAYANGTTKAFENTALNQVLNATISH